jgi:hypothetical protein
MGGAAVPGGWQVVGKYGQQLEKAVKTVLWHGYLQRQR